jgi:hypothetical protein
VYILKITLRGYNKNAINFIWDQICSSQTAYLIGEAVLGGNSGPYHGWSGILSGNLSVKNTL